jgi:hypothetical protein
MPTNPRPVIIYVDTGGGGSGDEMMEFVNVKDHGALGDNSTDDRVAVRAAFAAANSAGKGVYFPKGTYLLSQDPTAGSTAFGTNCSIELQGYSNMMIMGEGPHSILKMKDPQPPSTGDNHLIRCRANSNITIKDLTLDGNFPVGTSSTSWEEHTNLLEIGQGGTSTTTGVANITVTNCTFRNVRGDGIRLLGEYGVGLGDDIRMINITNNRFLGCHRSGICVQRGTYFCNISGNLFRDTNDQDIDFEPTSSAGNLYFTITNNVMYRSAQAGVISVTLTGSGASAGQRHERSVFSNNVIHNGMINALNIKALDITGNRVYLDECDTADPAIQLFKGCDDIRISGNWISRTAALEANAAACIDIAWADSVSPRGILIEGNFCRLGNTKAPSGVAAINVDDASDITIQNNTVYFDSTHNSPTRDIAIRYGGANVDCKNLKILNNTIIGDVNGGKLNYGVAVTVGGGRTMTNLMVANNQGQACTTGVFINSSGTMANYPVISGNQFTGATTALNEGLATTYLLSGQQGSQAIYRTNATPESAITAPIGSMAIVSTGGVGTSTYVKESGTGNTGWVALGAARDRGSLYISTPAATTLAAATPTKAAGTTTAGTVARFTHADNRLTYTGTPTRDFRVSLSVSGAKAAGTTSLVTLYLAKNGTAITGANTRLQVPATDEFNMSLDFAASLATNDYLEIFIATDTGDDVTLNRGTLVIDAE